MSKNQFTGTAMQPQRNRKIFQFNKDQYCTCSQLSFSFTYCPKNDLFGAYWTVSGYLYTVVRDIMYEKNNG